MNFEGFFDHLYTKDKDMKKKYLDSKRAKVDPFFAQIWNPLHSADEPEREYKKVVSE